MKNNILTRSSFLGFIAMVIFGVITTPIQAADAKPDDGAQVGTIAVPEKLNQKDVKACVINALQGRKYQIQQSDDGRVVASYVSGVNSLTLAVVYNAKEVKLYGKGTSRAGGLPTRWIDSIKKDIAVLLGNKLAEK